MFLNIGLTNGVLLRTVVDPVDGSLSDTRLRFLGAKPPKVVRVNIHGSPAVMAFSSRSWLLYTYQDLLQTQPIIYDQLEYASTFSASMCPDGLIGISGNTLRYVLSNSGLLILESLPSLNWARSSRRILHPLRILLESSSPTLTRHYFTSSRPITVFMATRLSNALCRRRQVGWFTCPLTDRKRAGAESTERCWNYQPPSSGVSEHRLAAGPR